MGLEVLNNCVHLSSCSQGGMCLVVSLADLLLGHSEDTVHSFCNAPDTQNRGKQAKPRFDRCFQAPKKTTQTITQTITQRSPLGAFDDPGPIIPGLGQPQLSQRPQRRAAPDPAEGSATRAERAETGQKSRSKGVLRTHPLWKQGL